MVVDPVTGRVRPVTVQTDVIHSRNPATEDVLEEVPVTDPDRVRQIIRQAKDAQPDWAEVPLPQREELLRSAADTLENNASEIAQNLTKEQGKPLPESRGEIQTAVERARYFCDQATDVLESESREVNENLTGQVERRPRGLIAAIKPWNFPVNIPLWTIVPALLSGNTVIFKPSELTPITGRKLIECFPDELFERNVLSLVQGGGEVGRTLVQDDDVDFVSFVGSRQTGEWIYRASAEHLRGIALELGGKDPMLVLEDADPERAAEGLMRGGFKNCGQVCCGIERCLVHESLYDEFMARVLDRFRKLSVGNGLDPETDVGPMIRDQERQRVQRHLEDAQEHGAEVLRAEEPPDQKNGFWQVPVLVTDADSSMRIMNEETFGPVVAIRTFNQDEEALGEANRLDYGLGAVVYSDDPEHARTVAGRIEAGNIGINRTVGSVSGLPWGGIKKSGVGRLLGTEGFKEFTEPITTRWNSDEHPGTER
jgi:acyl-CoA reductase-like NAD-dependent aldehyde dehydrogenase